MKELVEFFGAKKLLFSEILPIDLKSYGIKKRIEAYEAVDLKRRYVLIFRIERKSRFLQKDGEDLLRITSTIEQKRGHAFALKYVLLKAPLCSKAKTLLEKEGFRVFTL